MAVRKIRASWWVDFRVNHIRYRKRSPQNSRIGAIDYEGTLRQRLAKGEPIDGPSHTPSSITFGEFVPKWFEEYVVSNNKFSEQRTKKYILSGSLVPFFGNTQIGRITSLQIEQYKAGLLKSGVTSKTVNNRLTVLRKCLTTAREWLELDMPIPHIKLLKCRSERTDYLSEEECARLLGSAAGVIYELVLTALRTGMRQGELRGLQWSSIDWQTHTLAVQHSRCDFRKVLDTPKSNRIRHLPIDGEVYERLHKRRRDAGYVFLDIDGQPFDEKRLKHRLTALCARAGIRRITWHVLRHTFATHLAMKGVPLNVVQTLLGHSTITTTMRYAHVAPSSLQAAINLLGEPGPVEYGQPVVNTWLHPQQKNAAQQTIAARNGTFAA